MILNKPNTENNKKKVVDAEGLHKMVQKLMNEIISLKSSRNFWPYKKEAPPAQPPTAIEGYNLE